jgi:hypothetical protein
MCYSLAWGLSGSDGAGRTPRVILKNKKALSGVQVYVYKESLHIPKGISKSFG